MYCCVNKQMPIFDDGSYLYVPLSQHSQWGWTSTKLGSEVSSTALSVLSGLYNWIIKLDEGIFVAQALQTIWLHSVKHQHKCCTIKTQQDRNRGLQTRIDVAFLAALVWKVLVSGEYLYIEVKLKSRWLNK